MMPTPSDSTDDIPLHPERSAHTCPFENEISGEWRVAVLDSIGRATLESTRSSGALQQLEPPPTAETESLRPMGVANEPAEEKIGDCMTLIEPSEGSSPDSDVSPSASHADEKDGEHIQLPVPSTSALDLHYSIRYGIESTRVSFACICVSAVLG